MKILTALLGFWSGQIVHGDRGTHSRIGCGGNSLEIRCPGGTEIKVLQAMYGRFQTDTCQSDKNSYDSNSKCSLPVHETQQIVAGLCDRKSSCSISVEPATFRDGGDPCPKTSKYLNVKYECQTVAFDCPGVAFSSSPPIEHFTTYRQEGAWATDPLDNDGRVYFLPWDQSGATEMKEFRNLEDLLHSNQATYYRLDTRADGTGFVVRDRKLYYNKRQSRELVMYDLNRRFQARSVELPDANYYDTSPYAIEKNTDIDLAVDEQGLWAIYATEDNNGQIVVSRLDPDSMEVLESFNTDFEKTAVMEAWMTCGILYAVQADSENLLFMFDTTTGKHITGKTATRISLPELPAQTTSLKYDPQHRSLQAWALGTALTYQLRFQPKYLLYPTTTRSTTTKVRTTKRTTTTSTPRDQDVNNKCKATQAFGLHFPEVNFGEWVKVNCHGGEGKAKWLCGGNAKVPSWVDEPDMSECTSHFMQLQQQSVERATLPGVELSEGLHDSLRRNKNNLRPFDLYVTLDLVKRIHEQNPRLEDRGLEENLLKTIEIILGMHTSAVWDSLTTALEIQLDNDSVSLIQSLLSRMSCKLRLNAQTFDFAIESNSFKCWLEPTTIVEPASSFPVSVQFSRAVPNTSYRSLIKLDSKTQSSMWLGSLHTDCERPLTQYGVNYLFRNAGGNCAEPRNNGCRTETKNDNGTVCECSGTSGPVYLAQSSADGFGEDGHPVPVPIAKVDPADTALLAVLILAALLHGASGIASLLLKETSLVDIRGLHTAHRAINLLMMIGLITVSSTSQRMIKGEMSCSVISVFLHWLCVSTFTWCVVRPAYLALVCASPLRNLSSGWWLHVTATGLPLLITVAASATQMFPTHTNLCLAGPSMAFTWSAAGPAVILASLSMLLILYAATRLRDNNEFQLHVQQIRSSLLWVGLLTVLLSCEWGLILLWYSSETPQDSTIGIFLAAVAIFHAATNFICHCLCNIKAQRGCKSVLSAFGVREPQEKGNAEFFWSTAPVHNRGEYEHTLRPVGETMVPDCVQMTYANSNGCNSDKCFPDQSTMQLHPHELQTHPHQYLLASDANRSAFGTCPARRPAPPMPHVTPSAGSQSGGSGHGSIYNPAHSIIQNPSLPRMGYSDFRPTDGEFEFHQSQYGRGQNYGHVTQQPQLQQQQQQQQMQPQRRPLLNQHPNGDVEV